MANTKIGYKALRHDFTSALEEARQVQYKLLKWSLPCEGAGPLCCFSELEDVEAFVQLITSRDPDISLLIVECEYVPSVEEEVWSEPILCKRLSEDQFRLRSPTMGLHQLSQGTVLAECLKPTEVVGYG